MCVDVYFDQILTVTFYKDMFFSSWVLRDCQPLTDNYYCICETVLLSQSLQV